MSHLEENHHQLQKLLGCKRYEQPPPGFFLSFSDKVIARIQAEEAAEYSSWWTWLVERFDAKPVLVCAYGLAVSGLLFMGFRLSQVFEAELAAAPTVAGPWLAATPASPVLFSQEFSQAEGVSATTAPLFTSLRLTRGEDAGALVFPAGGRVLQPAGFPFHAR